MEQTTPDGRPIQLEPGGRFSHIAIAYEGGWLHAAPGVGVAWTSDLSQYGRITHTLTHLELPDLVESQVREFRGLPYDPEFRWNNRGIYCSELIAKLLGIPPETMYFEATEWDQKRHRLRPGRPGLSPDDLYRILRRRGFAGSRCAGLF